jgi:hypothetical protein
VSSRFRPLVVATYRYQAGRLSRGAYDDACQRRDARLRRRLRLPPGDLDVETERPPLPDAVRPRLLNYAWAIVDAPAVVKRRGWERLHEDEVHGTYDQLRTKEDQS